jgi:hypothetical protein
MSKENLVEMKKYSAIILILISGLFSALVSVVLTNILHERNELYNKKLEVLADFAGNRYDIMGEKFTQALNRAFIIYNNSEEVLLAIKNFHDYTLQNNRSNELANQKLLELFKAMCHDLGINTNNLNDNYFLMPFNIKK